MAFNADTTEKIYSIPVDKESFSIQDIDVFGDHLIAGAGGGVKIFEKMTDRELYSNKTLERESPVKTLKNVGMSWDGNGMICFMRRGANDDEWTEEKIPSGVPEITFIEEGEGSRLVIATEYGGILVWDIEERKVVPSEKPVLLGAARGLSVNFPHVCVIGGLGPKPKGLVVLNIATGKQIRHVETDFGIYNIHSNGRFVLVTSARREVIIYDMEELSDESIKDADLWSRRMSFTADTFNAVSNKTKFAVSYGKKLAVYDVWKDRDY